MTIEKLEIGKVYILDGISYRCLKKGDVVACFQRLNDDGTDYSKVIYPSFIYGGFALISQRINELKEK